MAIKALRTVVGEAPVRLDGDTQPLSRLRGARWTRVIQVLVENTGAQTAYLGGPDVSVEEGKTLAPGAFLSVDLHRADDALYARCAGETTLEILESGT